MGEKRHQLAPYHSNFTYILCINIFVSFLQITFKIIYLFYFLVYFICHTIITKNIGKKEKKRWRGDLTETIGAYERSIEEKKAKSRRWKDL